MRRPAPLPPPPDSPPPSPEAAPSRSAALGPPDAARPPAEVPLPDPPSFERPEAEGPDAERPEAEGAQSRAEDTAPVIPFAVPVRPPSSPAGAEQPLGLRDVWRAARARRRALRAEMRRFTVRQRRRRMLWLGVLGAVVLLVAGTFGVAYSPVFAVREIEVVGTSQLDAAALQQALSDQVGVPLARVDASAVKAALVRFPLVESYTLEARPPDRLVVRVVERMPVGVLQTPAGFTVVDAAGVALSTTPEAPPGLAVFRVAGEAGSVAFRAAGQVMRALPATLRPLVTGVSATTPDDVTLTLAATDTRIVWGSADESARKALALERTMQSRPLESTRLYDVSSPDAVVVG